jgi:hypothetical protein
LITSAVHFRGLLVQVLGGEQPRMWISVIVDEPLILAHFLALTYFHAKRSPNKSGTSRSLGPIPPGAHTGLLSAF